MKKRLLKVLVVLTGMFLLTASIVWADAPAPIAKTGQTTCYDTSGIVISCTGTGQDGDHQKGVASPRPRFTDNDDETVTDNLTGLIWAKNANIGGLMNWDEALDYTKDLSLGLDACGSSFIDWRLPNVKELQSLIDFSNASPALPSGHPFSNVQSSYYWSSTTNSNATSTDNAWSVHLYRGYVNGPKKTTNFSVWPVRGGLII